MDGTRKTIVLGIVFVLCLAAAYVENIFFFSSLADRLSNPLLSMLVIFIHNVLVVSLILVAMTFYVSLVLTFFPKRKYEYVVLEHPRLFAFIFTLVILLVSILRTSTLLHGRVFLESLALVVLVSAPNGIIEGYGIFQCINKTLNRNMTLKDLAVIYSIFFIAAIIETAYTQALLSTVTT